MKIDRDTYVKRILRMPRSRALTIADAQRPEMRLWRDSADPLVSYYAPFDYLNAKARLVLIGATPGHGQVPAALTVFRDALVSGRRERTAFKLAKERAAFLGMRELISSWLDLLGVDGLLEIQSCQMLWGEQRSLLHTTSAVRYPTFRRRRDGLVPYTGGRPSPVTRPRLLDMIDTLLGPELRRCRDAVIAPLGDGAHDAVRHLARCGVIAEERCLLGLPHPSGQNRARHKDVSTSKDRLRARARRAFAAVSA